MKPIVIQFDSDINAYIVHMPEYISFVQLRGWGQEFVRVLNKKENAEKKVAMLLETNRHKFESIECLKFLRNFLSEEPAIMKNISCVAFVAPKEVRPSQIVSNEEAYFSDYDDAYQWLSEKARH